MKFTNDDMINDVSDIITNTRDFCGDEKTAALEHLSDEYGITGDLAVTYYRQANFRANYWWNEVKKLAWVNDKYIF